MFSLFGANCLISKDMIQLLARWQGKFSCHRSVKISSAIPLGEIRPIWREGNGTFDVKHPEYYF